MRKFFSVILFAQALLCCTRISAQNYPVYNSFYINPYLYNPAEAGTENTWVFLNHRQQWTGIVGSPVLTTLNFNTLLNNSRAGVGAKVSTYKRGLLNTTDFTLTYAYGVPITEKNTVFFGLSGGAISSSIDVSNLSQAELDLLTTDPAFANYLNNNLQPVANFGILYRSASGLNFGVTLPQLFATKFNSSSSFSNTSISPFDNVFVSAYYRPRAEGSNATKNNKRSKSNKTGSPLEFYVLYKYAKAGNSQFEIMTKLNLSDNFWLGATYRQSYGFAAHTGISYNKFLVGYSFELPGQPEAGFSKGTHEIQLGIRLGEPKKFKRKAPTFRSSLNSANALHAARFQQTFEDQDNILPPEGPKKLYYVVIKAFADFMSADALKRKLIDQKYNADIFYYPKDKKYYVHVLSSEKPGDANEEVRNLKNNSKLKDARVLVVTDPK